MMKAYRINEFSNNIKLDLVELPIPKPNDNQILVKHTDITINYSDIEFCAGYYKSEVNFPMIPGFEGVGIVEELGKNVNSSIKKGDYVVYYSIEGGGYAEYNVVDKDRIFVFNPYEINPSIVACGFSKGIAADYLIKRMIKITDGETVLIHGASGGLGHVLCQFTKLIGCNVIATVLNEAQAEFVKSLGIKHIIDNSKQNFVLETLKITNGHGVGIVYDMLGGEFVEKSIKCMNFFGTIASVGNVLGKPKLLDLTKLDEKCLFVTRPRLEIYRFPKMEYVLSANDVITLLQKNKIKPGGIQNVFTQLPDVINAMRHFNTYGSCLIKF